VAGAGIGLALVQDVADAHGGRVEVEAPDGGGSRFIVVLPGAPPGPSPPPSAASAGRSWAPSPDLKRTEAS
jgi:hypothetical protein